MPGLQKTHGDAELLAANIVAGDRAALARAITLVESRKAANQSTARALVQTLLPLSGRAIRVGITGVPGVGKSTLIDALGSRLTAAGHRVAVLAVDPSSSRTGGSILGDKTRMARLSGDARAFIRPSPSAGTLGGVGARTREALLLCEAAGFDVILVETVGVGQSETAVCDLVDIFLVLMLAGAGDELQGIKKGVLELADIIAVTKADGDDRRRAEAAAADLRMALHLIGPGGEDQAPVTTVSAVSEDGLAALWQSVTDRHARQSANGALAKRRQAQQVRWLRLMLEDRVMARLTRDGPLRARTQAIERQVAAGELSPMVAVEEIAAMLGL